MSSDLLQNSELEEDAPQKLLRTIGQEFWSQQQAAALNLSPGGRKNGDFARGPRQGGQRPIEERSGKPLSELFVGQTVNAKVTKVKPDFAYVNIGAETEAMLPIGEFSDDLSVDLTERLNVYDRIQCKVLSVLQSRKFVAVTCKDRLPIEEKLGEEVEGHIKAVFEGHALVDIGLGLDARLPIADVGDEFLEDMREIFAEGDAIKGRIRYVNLDNKEITLTFKEGRALDQLYVGEEVEGEIRIVKPGFAIVDIGAITNAALPLAEVDFDYSSDLRDRFDVGDFVKCRILHLNLERQQISVTARSGMLLTELELGQEVEGEIIGVQKDYAFLDIGATTRAMLPLVETFDDTHPEYGNIDLREKLTVGDRMRCRITHIDRNKQHCIITALDYKLVSDFKVGEEVEGVVRDVKKDAAYVDIGTRSNAFLHSSELGDEIIEDLREKVSVGDTIRCRILSKLTSKQKTRLTCKEKPFFKQGE